MVYLFAIVKVFYYVKFDSKPCILIYPRMYLVQ